MKTYIILTPEIGNMGGAQMYTENKVSYLKNKGWKVLVVYFIYSENILLQELSEFRDLYFPDMAWGVQYVPELVYRKIVSRLKSKIGETDEIVIESQLLMLSFWGERLAESLNGRHIINFLEERIKAYNSNELAFFEYKLLRWEFMNAGERSLYRVFGNHYKDSYKSFMNRVNFVCSNVASEIDDHEYHFDECDFTISSIGRLDKEYILPMFDEIMSFVKNHPNKRLNIIVIGGSKNGDVEEKIKLIFEDISNVKIYLLGYTYPIPKQILNTINVGIACANSVLVTSDLGIPTICVDMNDSQAIGIFGHTTDNRFSRLNEPQQKISDLLEIILIRGKFAKSEVVATSEVNQELEKQINYLTLSQDNIGYYDIIHIYPLWNRIISQLKWILLHKKLLR